MRGRGRPVKAFTAAQGLAPGLLGSINMDYGGLGKAVNDLLSGKRGDVNVRNYQNGTRSFTGIGGVLPLNTSVRRP